MSIVKAATQIKNYLPKAVLDVGPSHSTALRPGVSYFWVDPAALDVERKAVIAEYFQGLNQNKWHTEESSQHVPVSPGLLDMNNSFKYWLDGTSAGMEGIKAPSIPTGGTVVLPKATVQFASPSGGSSGGGGGFGGGGGLRGLNLIENPVYSAYPEPSEMLGTDYLWGF